MVTLGPFELEVLQDQESPVTYAGKDQTVIKYKNTSEHIYSQIFIHVTSYIHYFETVEPFDPFPI